MAQNPTITQLDPGQIIKRSFDEANDRIRVDAEVTATFVGPQEVIISDIDDSIKIGDGTGTFADVTVANALKVDGSAVIQPVSGTVTITDGGGSITVDGPLTDAQLRATPVPVSGTVTSNIGTTGGLALESTLVQLTLPQSSTTSGQTGPLVQGAVTTLAPTYINGQTNPLSLTTAGALRTDSSATTQPVSGTVAATQSGTWNIGTVSTITNVVHVDDNGGSLTVDGTVAATQSGTWVLGANSGVDIGDVTVNNGAGAAAVNIQDGGNSITVDDGGGSITVDGTVAATQSGVWSTRLQDGAGNTITSTIDNGLQSLNVHVTNIITVASNTRPAVTNVASTILAANLNRKYVNIFNQSGSVIFLKLGATAVINEGIRVISNSMYEITSDNLWTGTISAIKSGAASVNIEVFEGT